MKKLMASRHVRQGFTLIELMIVIVILGVLMGTIIPRLTGAQARARDTGRIADLGNIAQALEVYYNDEGSYPTGTDGAEECLDPAGDGADTVTAAEALGTYMKGGTVPVPPSATQQTLGGCDGQYVYIPLERNGIANGSYVLMTDVETLQMANFDATDFAATEYNAVVTADLDAEPESAADSVYIYKP